MEENEPVELEYNYVDYDSYEVWISGLPWSGIECDHDSSSFFVWNQIPTPYLSSDSHWSEKRVNFDWWISLATTQNWFLNDANFFHDLCDVHTVQCKCGAAICLSSFTFVSSYPDDRRSLSLQRTVVLLIIQYPFNFAKCFEKSWRLLNGSYFPCCALKAKWAGNYFILLIQVISLKNQSFSIH